MDYLIEGFTKSRLARINRDYIDIHGSYFTNDSFVYDFGNDKYPFGYIEYISKILGVSKLTPEIVNVLLSVTKSEKNSIWKCLVNFGDAFLGVVMDSFELRLKEYARSLKNRTDRCCWADFIFLFRRAKKVLQSSPDIKSHDVIYTELLGLMEIDIILLKERQKFANEKDEHRRHLREEAQALKELKREKEQAEKDAAKAKAAIEKNEAALAKAKSEEQTNRLLAQIEELKTALLRAEERRERAQSMAQQTRCGYVYIISNIGSFGEGVYKIGMTRRVNPIDRVDELGDASVPFRFDVHAMIYTEDAPGLESTLHQKFHERRLNLDNYRKEFFRVPLNEIREEVERMGIVTTWVETPKAEQWRSSERIRQGENTETHTFAYEYSPFEEDFD